MAGEPGPCSAAGRGQTGEFSKSGCQIGVQLLNRQVSIKLVCLLLSKKKGRGKKGLHFHSMPMKNVRIFIFLSY